MTLRYRLATPADFPSILAMLRAFYAEDHIDYDPALVESGLRTLLAEPVHGAVLLLQGDGVAEAGYASLGWCFSIEQGGRFLLLDELYLAPAARGRGWGRQALALARDWAHSQRASVMRIEVNHHNARAKALYLAAGYRDDGRDILTLPLLATPTGLHA